MRILCVDDDPIFRKVFEVTLRPNLLPEDQMLFAQTGEEACAMIDQHGPEIVFADLVLPGISGLEVLRHAKSSHPCTEVIVVTGQASVDSAVEAMRSGARDYISKPINAGMLTEKLRTLREFLQRTREAEDYRFAKETIEENASQTVLVLERKVSEYQCVLSTVHRLLQTSETPEKKVRDIESALKHSLPSVA